MPIHPAVHGLKADVEAPRERGLADLWLCFRQGGEEKFPRDTPLLNNCCHAQDHGFDGSTARSVVK